MKKLFLVTGLALSLAATAAWGGPGPPWIDPAHCIVPVFIDLVGCRDGVVDPYGAFTVTVNSAGGFPIPGCEVEIVFASDLRVYSAVPGATVDCDENSVSALSDWDGKVTFDIAGATINTNGVATGSGSNGATIQACGFTLGYATVAVYDENGAVGVRGVNSADLAGWLGDFSRQGTIGYKGRSDFNHDGAIASNDLALWLKRFGGGQSSQSCGTLCP